MDVHAGQWCGDLEENIADLRGQDGNEPTRPKQDIQSYFIQFFCMICIYFTAAIKQGIDFIAEYKSPDEFHLFKFYAGSFFLHYVTHVL